MEPSTDAANASMEKPRKQYATRSDVWKYYTKSKDDPEKDTNPLLLLLAYGTQTTLVKSSESGQLISQSRNMDASNESQTGQAASSVTDTTVGGSLSSSSRCRSTLFSTLYQKMQSTNQCVESANELSIYLMEKVEVESANNLGTRYDILSWWRDNSVKFPVLSEIAKDVLAIPVSSVSSEFAFSTAGRILDPYWSSLSPSMVEALILT
ncbi:hypothetical protein Bca4012_062048 [Brassica carinata]